MKHARRAFLQSSAAWLSGIAAPLAAQDRFDQDALLSFWDTGNVTLLHLGDLHGQMMPHYCRPASDRLGPGPVQPPYLTGEAFRIRYGIGGGGPMDYAFTHEEFARLAGYYGPMGGLDRVATLVSAIRATRPQALFLTGAQNGQGAQGSPLGEPCAEILTQLHPETSPRATRIILREGVRIALLNIARDKAHLPWQIEDARAQGADLVVCLSQDGLAVDQATAQETAGIDLILSNASQTALPEPLTVGETRILASGTQGRFVARIDLKLEEGKITEVEHKLIPVFADLIRPDPQIAKLIRAARAPLAAELAEPVGQADELLYAQGTLSSAWDDVICAALRAQEGVPLALSPGFGWGNTVLPGQTITREDLYSLCGNAPARTYVAQVSGAMLKTLLEHAVESHFFAPGPARAGVARLDGATFSLNLEANFGERIRDLTLATTKEPVLPDQTYSMAGWGHRDRGVGGPPLWQILSDFFQTR